jgi:hypothetical protein
MFSFIRVRFEAARLARQLSNSLTTDPDAWKIERQPDGSAVITNGPFKVSLSARRLRLLDSIHLHTEGADVWLPLAARLRLRMATRLFLAHHGNEQFKLRGPSKRARKALAGKEAS